MEKENSSKRVIFKGSRHTCFILSRGLTSILWTDWTSSCRSFSGNCNQRVPRANGLGLAGDLGFEERVRPLSSSSMADAEFNLLVYEKFLTQTIVYDLQQTLIIALIILSNREHIISSIFCVPLSLVGMLSRTNTKTRCFKILLYMKSIRSSSLLKNVSR